MSAPKVSMIETLRRDPFSAEEEEEFCNKYKLLSTDSLEAAIGRGQMIKCALYEQKWNWEEIWKKLGEKRKTGYKFIQLVDHPRMRRTDWQKSRWWTVDSELLTWSGPPFEEMIKFCHRDTSISDIRLFLKAYQQRLCPNSVASPPTPKIQREYAFTITRILNKIECCDCKTGITELSDNIIGTVITSPPYAEQRKGRYPGVPPSKYPEWFCRNVMDPLWPVMIMDGNVVIVINTFVEDGQINDYVLRTRLAVRERGWFECGELIWWKPDAPHAGSNLRPRQINEQILWFSKSRQPYVNLQACGKPTKRKGLEGSGTNLIRTSSPVEGIADATNFVRACVGEIDNPDEHPAPYPPTLISPLILGWAKPGSIILDPFAGSGTTCLVAQSLGFDFIGFDITQDYVDKANRRLKTEPRYFPGAAKMQHEQEQLRNLESAIEERRRQIEMLRQASTLLPEAEADLAAMIEKTRVVDQRLRHALGGSGKS